MGFRSWFEAGTDYISVGGDPGKFGVCYKPRFPAGRSGPKCWDSRREPPRPALKWFSIGALSALLASSVSD